MKCYYWHKIVPPIHPLQMRDGDKGVIVEWEGHKHRKNKPCRARGVGKERRLHILDGENSASYNHWYLITWDMFQVQVTPIRPVSWRGRLRVWWKTRKIALKEQDVSLILVWFVINFNIYYCFIWRQINAM